MPYVHQSRPLSQELILERGTNIGRPGYSEVWNLYGVSVPAPQQETFSWRSGLEYDDFPETESQAVREWLSTTRNGFTLDGRFDNGHEFYTSKEEYHVSHPSEIVFGRTTGAYSYQAVRGCIVPSRYDGRVRREAWSPRWVTTSLDVKNYGARLIEAASPTNPHANLSTALGEIVFDGLPSLVGAGLWSTRCQDFRAYGSEYLNVAFGWAPFVSDIKKVVSAVLDASSIISGYEKNAGLVVRRKRFLPDEITSDFTSLQVDSSRTVYDFLTGSAGTGFAGTASRLTPQTLEQNTRHRTWFAGAFQFYLQTDPSVLGKLERYEQLANQLLGTRLTPATLWELAPWSWIVDWFSNVGAVINNATMLTSDGLVLRYGYLMRETTQVRTFRTERPVVFYNNGPIQASATYVTTTKERFKASPYGFSVSLDGLSDRQWAILAALGLTRAPRSLR